MTLGSIGTDEHIPRVKGSVTIFSSVVATGEGYKRDSWRIIFTLFLCVLSVWIFKIECACNF